MLTSSMMKQARKQFGLRIEDVVEYPELKAEIILKIEGNQHVMSHEEHEKLLSYFHPYFRMINEISEDVSFYQVFQEKEYAEKDCLEMKRLDLLLEALYVQEQLLIQ